MKNALIENGYVIENDLFSEESIADIIQVINASKATEKHFAIRQFLQSVPVAKAFIFNHDFCEFFKKTFGEDYFLIKAIYFDKPPNANWIVPWHQDLTIVTNQKKEVDGFSKWRLKNGKYYVQPTPTILENIITIRIHLDDCTAKNGALKVIEGSHLYGIAQKLDFTKEKPVICEVKKGGVLVMKPLIYHASKRTENNLNRRVIHLEFTNQALPKGLAYGERIDFLFTNR